MPIFRVEAEIEVMVFAKDWEEAEREARDAVREELRWNSDGFTMYGPDEVTDPLHLFDWKDARPHNRDDNLTCAQIMELEAERKAKTPPTIEEIEAAGQQRLVP